MVVQSKSAQCHGKQILSDLIFNVICRVLKKDESHNNNPYAIACSVL